MLIESGRASRQSNNLIQVMIDRRVEEKRERSQEQFFTAEAEQVHYYINSIELAKIMREKNPMAKLTGKHYNSAIKPYNGESSLYDGEGRGMVGGPGIKKSGHVTNYAESKI